MSIKNTVLPIFIFPILLIGMGLSGCRHPLLITPEIPTGGLNTKSPEEYPTYSGDVRYLAFASERQGHLDIYLIDLQQKRLVSFQNFVFLAIIFNKVGFAKIQLHYNSTKV